MFTKSRSSGLVETALYQHRRQGSSFEEQVDVSFQRARMIAGRYGLTTEDILMLTDKFFDMHCDPIHALDMAPITLLTIHYNLAAGTIGRFARQRPELKQLMEKILRYDISAQFMLTEVGHGLDARNMETTATLSSSGEYDLHTPGDAAAKHMPPTGPAGGIPKIAVVIARLIVRGDDHGLRPFIVPLNDGHEMCLGVTSASLPHRFGSKPVGHSITYFNHVKLPSNALLGSLDKPGNDRANFLQVISRVTIGSLALSLIPLGALTVATDIAARYSIRRQITSDKGDPIPIWSLRTQQLPILHALAKCYVMKAHAKKAIQLFKDDTLIYPVRMGIAASFKAVMTRQTQESFTALSERMGAQGLFEHNMIIAAQLEARGISIAEGDVLALSIRLATELLLGRYQMPRSQYPDSLLASHEIGVFAECRSRIAMLGNHRSDAFNRAILPLCQPLVDAIGCRMAYEAALDAGVAKPLLDLYEAGVLKEDGAWYARSAGLTWWAQHEMEEKAASATLPSFEKYLDGLCAKPFSSTAPIYTGDSWESFIGSLDTYAGFSTYAALPVTSLEIQARL